jgi:hypothetical protein
MLLPLLVLFCLIRGTNFGIKKKVSHDTAQLKQKKILIRESADRIFFISNLKVFLSCLPKLLSRQWGVNAVITHKRFNISAEKVNESRNDCVSFRYRTQKIFLSQRQT